MNRIYIPLTLRQAVIERASKRCEYCQTPGDYSPELFEVEHIQPLTTGGVTELSNLALSCPACNRFKSRNQYATDLETGQTVPLFNPRTHNWTEHFNWSGDFCSIKGLTPIGRVTVTTLRMNRPSVQRFRTALQAIGQHPAQKRSDKP